MFYPPMFLKFYFGNSVIIFIGYLSITGLRFCCHQAQKVKAIQLHLTLKTFLRTTAVTYPTLTRGKRTNQTWICFYETVPFLCLTFTGILD